MLNLARFSVNRPVTAGIISVALFVLGMFAVFRMPVSLYPEVSFPFVTITVPYPGASPEQIEAAVVKPLEKELAGISGLSRLIGLTRQNGTQVIVGFKMSASEEEAVDAVRERVGVVKGTFPSGVEEPVIRRVDVGATPILVYGVETKTTAERTKEILDAGLIRALQRTDGVSEAAVLGLGEERIELQLDAAKLGALRVAPLDVFEQLQQKMAVIPWGEVEERGQVITVARGILPADPEYWRNELVTLRDGRGVRLGEVGTIAVLRDEKAPSVFINGTRGLGLVITKRSDANTVDTVSRVSKAISRANLPEGMKLFPIINQAEYIQENAHEVWIALFVGGAFAIAIILLFLTDVKSALISATALPVSIAGSFIFMQALGFSLNMMSLLALALAIGLLIDDAVVVRESIYSEMERGVPGKEAAVTGTDKVAAPVIATTLAVIAVFLPVGAMDGLVGQFFKQFGITICISVALSTWVAFTLDPLLSASFAGHPQPLRGRFWDAWRSLLGATEQAIARLGSWSFRHPVIVILLSVVCLVVSAKLSLSRGADFLAFEDRGQFIVNVKAPVGSPREAGEALAREVVDRLRGLEGLKDVYATVGSETDEREVEVRFVFTPKTERVKGLLAIQAEARKRLKGLSGDVLLMEPPPIEGVGGEAPLTVFVYGEDLEAMLPVARKLRDDVAALPGVAGVRIENDAFGPSFDVSLKPQDMGFVGSQAQAVELTGRLALTGLEAGNVGTENVPFQVRLAPGDRNMATLWDSLLVPTLRGPMFLGQFAERTEAKKAMVIDRERRSRKLTLWGTLDRTRAYGDVLADVERLASGVGEPFQAEVAGDKEVFQEMVESFALAIAGSLFFIFVILAAQFENLMRPFVILLTLPLAIIGGFLALYAAGQQLALGALIGLILLIGLAAKNGILLVDAIGVKEKEQPLAAAVHASVLERTRPILMTSIAMIFGMVPTALLRGGGSEFRSPMAIAIIGGVVSSTLLSFMVVPAVFGLVGEWRKFRGRGQGPGTPGEDVRERRGIVGVHGLLVWGLAMAGAALVPCSVRAAVPQADMAEVRALVRDVGPDAAERASIAGAELAAEGAGRAAILGFLGGARLEVGREWYRPGVTQSFDLPVFTPRGPTTVGVSSIVVPRAQNVFSAGWQIPLLNLQALHGLRLAGKLSDNAPLVRAAKLEAATLSQAKLWLEAELALQAAGYNEAYHRNAEARLRSLRDRKQAGLASGLDESESVAHVQTALVQAVQARTEARRLAREFELRTGRPLKETGLGLPAFPYAGERAFRSLAVDALDSALGVQKSVAELQDAASYPTVFLELGYQRKDYGGAPDPQTYLALKARWDLLDGGVRVRTVTEERRREQDLLAQKRELEIQLRAGHGTLATRKDGLDRALLAARVSKKAAADAQAQAEAGYKAGLVRAVSLRDADEASLRAAFAELQVLFALQGLAVESLALTGGWSDFLRGETR